MVPGAPSGSISRDSSGLAPGVAGDDRRPSRPAPEGVLLGLNAETAQSVRRLMACEAALLEQGADLGVEVHGRQGHPRGSQGYKYKPAHG